jgi:hypothetical protein
MNEVPSAPHIVSTEGASEGNPPMYSTAPLRGTHLHEKLSALPHLATSPDLSTLAAYAVHIICPASNNSITTHLKHRIGGKVQYSPSPTLTSIAVMGIGVWLMVDPEWRLDV